MNRKTPLQTIAAVGGLAVLMAACGSTPQVTVQNAGAAKTGVSVSGMGEVTGAPDTVEIDLGVSVLGETVDQATATAAERAEALIAALTSNGVVEDDITTTDYSIYPEYDYSRNQERLVGYRVNNTVRAKIRNMESIGSVFDAASGAAGDETRINGLRFSIEDNTELVSAARAAAWDDALAKATQLAELSGQTLGKATSITETVSMPPVPFPYEGDIAGAERAVTPIEPGTSAVTITLEVQFALEG